ncbi:MAG: NADH:ubiquinone reductase (Na(+)-transporting) subunit C [Flavobacteriales bacterium]|nr:NADH:ubiquinone reductase (Na(+)-transporting) subunit C [Flavobacteriales bacterium]
MAYDKNSNFATFAFAIGMVVVFGTVLTVIKLSLTERQKENERVKKMMDILGAVLVESDRENAQTLYTDYLKDSYVINSAGERVEDGPSAFDVDIKKDFRDRSLAPEDKYFPLYVLEQEGEQLYVVPMVGKGLWGPIWGFVSVKGDYKTIYGAKFDHKTETPGLGAEIKEDLFLKYFNEGDVKKELNPDGKKYFEVLKGGSGASEPYQVDGITGGTITSKGVEEMMNRTFDIYYEHFENLKQ